MFEINGRLFGLKVKHDTIIPESRYAPDYVRDIRLTQMRVQQNESIIRSYGLHPNRIPADVGDFCVARGFAKSREFVCIECYKLFTNKDKTQHRKCENCRSIIDD